MQSFPIQKRFVQGPDFIELTPDRLEEQLAFAEANNVSGFIIGPEWKNAMLPDLGALPAETIRGLHITFEAVHNTSALNNFRKLEVLYAGYMSYPQTEIHLANFPELRVVNINWNKNVKSLDQMYKVVRLDLWGYKPKSRDLRELQNCNNLVYARLTQPGVDCLDGIENLVRMKELTLVNVRSLKQFFSAEKEPACPLEALGFEACPHFDPDTIPAIKTLKRLSFSQVGIKQTLKHVLPKFPNLEALGFTQSALTDSHLEYLLEHPTLKKVVLDHKKHYSMNEKEIQTILDKRNKKFV